MNSEDLKKLREMLTKQKPENKGNYEYRLVEMEGYEKGEYDRVWKEEILRNKKPAQEVADTIVNMLVEAVYTFHNNGFDNLDPTLTYAIHIPYLFDRNLIGEHEYFKKEKHDLETFGDIVKIDFSETDFLLGYRSDDTWERSNMFDEIDGLIYTDEPEKFDEKTLTAAKEIKGRAVAEREKFYKRCCGDKRQIEDVYVSYNELVVELTGRGFYVAAENFDDMKKESATALKVCQEEITPKFHRNR